MKFLPDVGIYQEAQNQEEILTQHVWSVNYRMESQLPDMLTLRNCVSLLILTSEIDCLYYRTICKMPKMVTL